MVGLSDLIDRLRKLLPNTYSDCPDPSQCFRACIERYLKDLDDNNVLVEELQNMEINEAFVHCCLHFLQSLTKFKVMVEDGKPVFSVFQSQQISKCVLVSILSSLLVSQCPCVCVWKMWTNLTALNFRAFAIDIKNYLRFVCAFCTTIFFSSLCFFLHHRKGSNAQVILRSLNNDYLVIVNDSSSS